MLHLEFIVSQDGQFQPQGCRICVYGEDFVELLNWTFRREHGAHTEIQKGQAACRFLPSGEFVCVCVGGGGAKGLN
jgi:hypothetical protein